jgi:hypothetical protein
MTGLSFLDTYTIRARLFPAVLAAAPALALAGVSVSWDKLALSQLIATIALGVLIFVLADLARRRGKRVEPIIEQKLGGRPSALRHSDDTLDSVSKQRYLDFLATKLNEAAPSQEDEERAPDVTQRFYERGSAWLRENTRDTKKFRILFEENITYGFRRNLYGLKWPALILNIAVVFVCAVVLMLSYFRQWQVDYSARFLSVIAIAALHATYIFFAVTEQGVVEASKQYARQLALSCESFISAGSKPKPVSRRKLKSPI